MSDNHPIRISRTDIGKRRRCEMQRFLARHWADRGIQAKGHALPLIVGQTIHTALARIWLQQDATPLLSIRKAVEQHSEELLSAVTALTPDTVAQTWIIQEQIWLISCLVMAWVTHRYPLLRAEYVVVSVEEETECVLTPRLTIPLRMDAILRRRTDGMLFILDYKTSGWVGEGWADEHENSLQTVVYTYALAHNTQEPVGGMIYEPLLKGKRELMASGPWREWPTQNSPLCYHWKGPTGERVWKWTNRKGFTKVAAWEEFATVDEFLQTVPEDVLMKVVGTTTAFMPDPVSAARQLQSIAFREEEFLTRVDVAKTLPPEQRAEILTVLFEQNHDMCRSFGGRKCEFYDLCHSSYGLYDPMGTGLYETRVDHHAQPEEL